MRLKDKVAVVTGGGQGIGRGIALALAREGARCVLAARTRSNLEATQDEIEAAGGEAIIVPTDLRAPEEIERLAGETLEHFGHVDVLVNNSGIAGPMQELWKIDPAEWDETFDVNVRGVFLTCKAFLPAMIERRSGNVIIIGSPSGKRPLHGRSAYATGKLGLVGLVRTLAWEIGPYGLRVNLISPSGSDGPRMHAVIRGQAETRGLTYEEVHEEFVRLSPLGQFTPVEDVGNAAVFLASDEAASITGEDLNVSSGLVMY
ncbi:SDR family NAD(P)-dependent oxidoreductase [Amycolatopsis pithecellobii]|uniref:SDR family NAD(P)-dependent oxidoreductase n=1 Tax=Amycolatopsis pithecellobii TaxID=664692 RepID=UPI0014076D9D|nr:SDR family NAD(P)-dependent oxidoreductase [Amycolatopsis pithecellobii]